MMVFFIHNVNPVKSTRSGFTCSIHVIILELWLEMWHDIHPDKKTEFVTKGQSFQFQMPIIVWDFGQIKDFLNLDSLEAAGILKEIANYLDSHIPISELIASAIGVVSAIINKVPLVAAAMGMYDLSSYPRDSQLWQLV
ncbi:hypothetical protein Tco_0438414 [Tanacetum coccineum]